MNLLLQYFNDMKKLHLFPNPHSYQIIISTFSKCNDFESVNKFITLMIKNNIVFNEAIFITIINNLSKVGDISHILLYLSKYISLFIANISLLNEETEGQDYSPKLNILCLCIWQVFYQASIICL